MPVRAPMDRQPFPPLRAQSEESEQLEQLARLLLDEYLEQYDHFQLQTYGLVRADWSPLMQRDALDIYQQRTPQSDSPRSSSAENEIVLPRLMAMGTIHASLEDVMFATVAPTSEAMHVKMAATRCDDIDGLVLHTTTHVAAVDPFRYCGVKWVLRRAPSGLSSFVKQRDFVFLEATGINVRPDGERIGYHLCHSIEFAVTPALSRRGIVRGKMATCHFYRELTQSKVDVWAIATIDMQGGMWKRVALSEGATAIASICDLPSLALTKKLMWFHENRPPQLSPTRSTETVKTKVKSSSKCYHCGKAPPWPWKKRRRCETCCVPVCSTCSETITVFQPGLDPRTHRDRVRCCMACVLTLSDHNDDVYASQSRLDPSQRGSTPTTGAFGEDIRPKYDKAPSRFLSAKKRRSRTCSGDSGATLTSSVVSMQSTATCGEPAPRPRLATHAETSRRLSASRFNLADTLLHLQALADATYATQSAQNERLALATACERRRARASSSP